MSSRSKQDASHVEQVIEALEFHRHDSAGPSRQVEALPEAIDVARGSIFRG